MCQLFVPAILLYVLAVALALGYHLLSYMGGYQLSILFLCWLIALAAYELLM